MVVIKKILALAVSSALLLSYLPAVVCAAESFAVSAESVDGTAVLSWQDQNAASYVIERAEEKIGEVDGTILTFTDFEPKVDDVGEYTVDALDELGNVTKSGTTQTFIQDVNTIVEQMIFDVGNGSTIQWESGQATHFDHTGVHASRDGDWRGLLEADKAIKPGKSIDLDFNASAGYIEFVFDSINLYDIKNNGFLGFLVYTENEINDLPTVMFGHSDPWTFSSEVALQGKIVAGKWSFVKINIVDVMKSVDLTRIDRIRFNAGTSKPIHHLYVQGLGFYKSSSVIFNSVTENKGKVSLDWSCDNPEVEYYNIFCNNKKIAETKDKAYKHIVAEDNIFYTYYVEACNAAGRVLSTTDERRLVVNNANFYEYFMIYKDSGVLNGVGGGEDPNWTSFENDSVIKAYGDRSLKFTIYDGVTTPDRKQTNNIFMTMEKTQDFTELKDTGYLQFLIYADAQRKEDLPSVAFCSSGYKFSNHSSLENIELNKWNFVKLKISDLLDGNTMIDLREISELRWFMPSEISKEYHIYIQNLGFYNEVLPPTAMVTESGIDKDGNSYADIKFSKAMEEASLSDGFSVENMNVTRKIYSSEEQKVRLFFDKQLEFPREYMINVADSVVCTFDRPLVERKIKFKTGNIQDCIYINSCNVDKSKATVGTIKITADITAIYYPNASKMNVAMYTAVYSRDKLVAFSRVDIDDLEIKTTRSNIEDIITFPVSENMEEIKTEVFFVDKNEFGRPLCAEIK